MKQQLIIKRGETVIKSIPLPDFGEVTVTTHEGNVKSIDTRTKELIREPNKPRFEGHNTIDRAMKEKKVVEGPL